MDNNEYYEKSIRELRGYKFVIPAYQRGYRWTKTEVKAFLDDINEFNSENETKLYCIQPLIVKKNDDEKYEVVDGQQRLTTIYICLKRISEDYKKDSERAKIPYELEYQTREDSKKFLENISENHDDDSNIDFYYMSEAYKVIDNWYNEHSDDDIRSKILKSTAFIWHEMPKDSNPIEMFTKVNLGKIKLTNSELIKALLLSKDNFKSSDNDKIKNQQLEMSHEWDEVEQGLQNDLFWYFLNNKEAFGPRIDLIFELLADKYNEFEISKDEEEYYSFLVLSEKFKRYQDDKSILAKNIWEEAKGVYEEFKDWYNNLNKYHIVGFLTSIGTPLKDIYLIATSIDKKSKINSKLIDKIKNNPSIRKVYNEQTDTENNSYIDLDYKISSDKQHIRNILLFFNIATLYCKGEKQYRFPFDIFHKEKWDIEHIHATNSEEDGEEDNNIENLTLLDYKTNREHDYSNKPFSEKRKIIICKDSRGKFVPICTKNVFLKVYSTDKLTDKWEDDDKIDYVKAIIKTFKEFFNEGEEKNGEN